MTDYNKVFLDTAPFIYFIEKDSNNPQYFDNMKQFLEEGYRENKEFLTSVITMAEYFVFPYRNQKMSYIDSFHRLVDTLDMEIAEVDQEIAKKAAQIRAQYKNFKAMDALHPRPVFSNKKFEPLLIQHLLIILYIHLFSLQVFLSVLKTIFNYYLK